MVQRDTQGSDEARQPLKAFEDFVGLYEIYEAL